MNTGYDKASFDERMTLVQAAEACRFRPGDLVTHAACAPGRPIRFVVVTAFVPVGPGGPASVPHYFVRGVKEGHIELEFFQEPELVPLDDCPVAREARKLKQTLDEIRKDFEASAAAPPPPEPPQNAQDA